VSGGSRPALAAALGALGLLAAPGPAAGAEDVEVYDPWEGVNRAIFEFNERLDRWVLEPVAKGWDFVVPDPVETGLSNVFHTLRFPVIFGNDVLQAKFGAAAVDLARFAVNATVGVAGFFDPATRMGLEAHDEDLGQTLAVLGVPEGPYFVIPLLGPSTVRDTGGLVGDSASGVYSWFSPFWVGLVTRGTDLVNTRSIHLESLAEERRQAFDFYAAARSAYLQNRRARVLDEIGDSKRPADEEQEDLYYLEEGGE
jgi:phospholipid-binding lipoprotein MlaA